MEPLGAGAAARVILAEATGKSVFAALFGDPTFWVAVAFLVFVGLMVWKARGPLVAALDGRAARIKNELDEAQKLREEAQALLAEYKRKQRDAVSETKEMVEHAKEEGQRLREKAEADIAATLARREQQALDRIAQAEAQATADVRNLAVDIAVSATRKLLADNLDSRQAAKLVDEAIKELPEKLH